MKISRIQTQNKDFNGNSYTEFKLFCFSSSGNVCVTTTGRTSVCFVSENGTVLDETRLDKATLKSGDIVSFWRDDLGKLVQIDVLVSEGSTDVLSDLPL